jgi:hypothetical protein
LPARLIGQWLSGRLGQPFVIENRPGAGTYIGTEAVVRATPDGYTLLLVASVNAINATLYDKRSLSLERSICNNRRRSPDRRPSSRSSLSETSAWWYLSHSRTPASRSSGGFMIPTNSLRPGMYVDVLDCLLVAVPTALEGLDHLIMKPA